MIVEHVGDGGLSPARSILFCQLFVLMTVRRCYMDVCVFAMQMKMVIWVKLRLTMVPSSWILPWLVASLGPLAW